MKVLNTKSIGFQFITRLSISLLSMSLIVACGKKDDSPAPAAAAPATVNTAGADVVQYLRGLSNQQSGIVPQSTVGIDLNSKYGYLFDNGSGPENAPAYQQFQARLQSWFSVSGAAPGTLVPVNPTLGARVLPFRLSVPLASNIATQPGVPVPAGTVAQVQLTQGGILLWVLNQDQSGNGFNSEYRLETVTFQGTHVVIQALSTDSRQRITLDGVMNGYEFRGRLNFQNLQVNNQSGFLAEFAIPTCAVFTCNL
jgi:hypothetical protein